MTALDHLSALENAIESGSPILEPTAQWLRSAIVDYIERGTRLDVALGLDPSARYAILRARRNEHLRRAWRALPADLSPWQKSAELARQARRFTSDTWPRVRMASKLPARLTEIQSHLWHAARAGVPLPCTSKGMHEATGAWGSKVVA